VAATGSPARLPAEDLVSGFLSAAAESDQMALVVVAVLLLLVGLALVEPSPAGRSADAASRSDPFRDIIEP
jgi:hypothetical protein